MDVSVLIATCRRAPLLDLTLRSLAGSAFPSDRFEVLVADNADDAPTREVCERLSGILPVRYLVEPTRGKNAALNRALPLATGRLIAFTDDDVQFPPDWLDELWAGAARWPDHVLFGGKVLPGWPGRCPGHLRGSRYLGVCFSVLDRPLGEGPHPAFRPFGPNMAVRAEVFEQGMRFNPAVGPGEGQYIMGSETELIRRLQEQGDQAVYLPRCWVRHLIRAEQLSVRWLLSRGFRYGRKLAFETDGAAARRIAGIPRWLFRELARRGLRAGAALVLPDARRRFEEAMDLSVSLGMVYQFRHSLLAESSR